MCSSDLGGMYGGQVAALSPYTTYLGGAGTVEQLGQQPLDIGAQLGGRSATAGAQAGQSLLYGGLGAAKTLQEAQSQNTLAKALMQFGTSSLPSSFNRGNMQSMFSQTGLGQSGFGTGLAYGNQDYGLFI